MIFKQIITINRRITTVWIQNIRRRQLNRFWHTNTRNHYKAKNQQSQNCNNQNIVGLELTHRELTHIVLKAVTWDHGNKRRVFRQAPKLNQSTMKKNTSMKVALTLGFLLAFADQTSKWLASTQLSAPSHITPWFSLQYTQNNGIAFSMPIHVIIIITLSLSVLLAIIFLSANYIKITNPIAITSISLLIGGALGTLYDRLAHGYVIDFIKIGWWPVFNLADAFLTTGIFLAVAFYGKIKKA